MTGLLIGPETEERMGRPKKQAGDSKRNDAAAKLDADLIRKAKIVCSVRGVTIAEYLSELLAPIVNRDYVQAAKQIGEEAKVLDKPRR